MQLFQMLDTCRTICRRTRTNDLVHFNKSDERNEGTIGHASNDPESTTGKLTVELSSGQVNHCTNRKNHQGHVEESPECNEQTTMQTGRNMKHTLAGSHIGYPLHVMPPDFLLQFLTRRTTHGIACFIFLAQPNAGLLIPFAFPLQHLSDCCLFISYSCRAAHFITYFVPIT